MTFFLIASHVVPQHQLDRMRLQIDLVGQIRHPAAPDVMGEQRERHHQRHTPAAVVLDESEQFGPALAVAWWLEENGETVRWRPRTLAPAALLGVAPLFGVLSYVFGIGFAPQASAI